MGRQRILQRLLCNVVQWAKTALCSVSLKSLASFLFWNDLMKCPRWCLLEDFPLYPTYVWSFNHSQTSLPLSEFPSLKYLSHWVKTSQFTLTHLNSSVEITQICWLLGSHFVMISSELSYISGLWHLESKWRLDWIDLQCCTGNCRSQSP